MGGKGVHPTGNTPDVDIMHLLYSWSGLYIGKKFLHLDGFGRGFQQDIGRFTQDTPGTNGNQDGNADREDRVHWIPTREQDDDARNNDTHTRSHIPKDMEGSGFRIQVVALFGEPKPDKEIESNANSCRHKHDDRLNWLRMKDSLDGFKEHPGCHQNERDSIDLRGEDTHAVIAKGFARIGRSLCLGRSKPGQS